MPQHFKLTEEVICSLAEAISMGSSYALAANYAGVSESSLMQWLSRGRLVRDAVEAHLAQHGVAPAGGKPTVTELPDDGLRLENGKPTKHTDRMKLQLLVRLKGVEGAAALKWLTKIEKAASEGTWQAAAWKLERRYPQTYGRSVQQVEVGAVKETGDGLANMMRQLREAVVESDVDRADEMDMLNDRDDSL